jgi:hypothetical protein
MSNKEVVIILHGYETEGVFEQGAEDGIWTEEGLDDGRMEKIA